MAAFSGFQLWDAAVGPAQQKRFVRMALLADPTCAGEGERPDDLAASLRWLSTVPYEVLFVRQRPFFWDAIEACIRAIFGTTSEAGRTAAGERAAIFAFDAFFHACPEGYELTVKGTPGQALVLPELGLRVPGNYPLTLRKQAPDVLAVRSGGSETLTDVNRLPSALCWSPVPIGSQDRRLVTEAGYAMFSESYRGSIAPTLDDAEAFELAQTLIQALDFLAELDGSLGNEIAAKIRLYAPLKSADPHVHLSFSAPKLTGVIFLSQPTPQMGVPGWLKAAEVLVHEFAHNELNLYQEAEVLFEHDLQACFYSPWRKDPRPLNGLLHGLYAFWHVVEFLRCAELSVRTVDYHPLLRRTRHRMLLQLDIAGRQLKSAFLSPRGAEIVDAIGRGVTAQLKQFGDVSVPEIEAHIAEWRLRNPAHAARLWGQ